MALRVKKIELVNFRSHENVVFEPAKEGITALQGANGAGKSSILDGLAWALFGTKPDGVSKVADLFRTSAELTAPASVKAEVIVDGRHLKIERRRVNKHGAIECEVWAVTSNSDGEEELEQLAGPAVSHAEPFIRKALGMDEKGFLAAILVQQKQVDQLISANPRERGAVIENLTGIAGITAALIESRQEFNSLKKAASFSNVDETKLEKTEKEHAAIQNTLQESYDEVARAKAKAGELRNAGLEIKAKLTEASKKFEAKQEVEKKLADSETRLTMKQEAFEEMLIQKDKEKKALTQEVVGDYDDLKERLEELQEKRQDKALAASRAEDSFKSLRNEEKDLNQVLVELEGLTGDIETAETSLNQATETITLNERLISTKQSEVKQYESAVKVIEHGDSCPTCLQVVEDVEPAVKALEKLKNDALTVIETSKQDLQTAKNLQNEAKELIKSLEIKANKISRLKEVETALKKQKKLVDSEKSELLLVDGELKTLSKQFEKAKQVKTRQESYAKTLKKTQELSNEVDELEVICRNLKKENASMESASQKTVNSLREKIDNLRSKHSEMALKHTTLKGEAKLKTQKLEFLASEIERYKEEIKKHKELMTSVSVASHTVELISEFREQRIKSSIPVIEVHASELLGRFTEGKFNRLTLDQKFNATVYLADGTPRSVGLLSGGELSAAAMSLRLAISMLLNSGAEQNSVILDEVLVSQDIGRAEQMLATIKELFKGQVILVAHNESIDAVADKIVTLENKS